MDFDTATTRAGASDYSELAKLRRDLFGTFLSIEITIIVLAFDTSIASLGIKPPLGLTVLLLATTLIQVAITLFLFSSPQPRVARKSLS